ncbi:MAG: hypothetical protein MK101_11435 [Phycisphaerales bacterium]|nr:hypothetical protein [Phycisphaerales bacterium]
MYARRSFKAAAGLALMSALAVAPTGCSSDGGARPATAGGRLDLGTATDSAMAAFRNNDKASKFFDSAYGWAIFPKITKGAAGVGIASGRGQVYEEGKLAGYAKLTSVTLGAQLGGQTFSEIIFFKDRFAFQKFTNGQFVGSASAGAVSGKQGGTNVADYSDGVAMFTSDNNGLIVAADVGGQQFDFTPVK